MSSSPVQLDTNVFSYLGRSRSNNKLADLYLPHVRGRLLTVSFVTVGELYFGAQKGNWDERKIDRLVDRLRTVTIIPYDRGVCETYARLKASLPKGRTIADNDVWIAACAVRHSMPLITHNRKHFCDFRELILISEQTIADEIASQVDIPFNPKE